MAVNGNRKAVTTLAEVETAFEGYKSALSALGEETAGWELAVIPGKGFRIFGATGSDFPTRFDNKEHAADTMTLWATVVRKVSDIVSRQTEETPDEIGPVKPSKTPARKASVSA